MNCPIDDITMIDFVEGELEAEEAARVQQHLDQCPACRHSCRAIAGTRQVLAERRRGAEKPLEQFWQDNLAAIAAATYEKSGAIPLPSAWRSFTPALRYMAAAAVVVIALVSSFRLGFFERSKQNQAVQVAQQSEDERVQALMDSLYILAEAAHRYNLKVSTLKSIENLSSADAAQLVRDGYVNSPVSVYDELMDMQEDQLQQVLYVLASNESY